MNNDVRPGGSYRIVLRGELGDHFATQFEGMRMEPQAGTTVLTGPVVDQAQLHGLIARIQDLGVELVSIQQESLAAGSAR